MFLIFCKITFLNLFTWHRQYHHNGTTEKCQILLKSCYSVGYNYQIYQCIFRLAAMNINNVVKYCTNIHDLSFHATIYADWQTVVYSDCVTLLHIVPLQFLGPTFTIDEVPGPMSLH